MIAASAYTSLGAAFGAVAGAARALAGGEAVSVDLDRSVLLQMVIFALLIIVLRPLLFDPVLRVFAMREERTEGAKAEARRLQERAGELLRKYEVELEKVHQVAAEERERMRNETAALEAQILSEAREATTKIINEGRHRMDTEVHAIRDELSRDSQSIARQLAAAALGREVS